MKNLLRIFLFLVSFSSFGQNPSVLSSGKWYKIGVTQTGVHRIDLNLLKAMGVDAASVNPANIQLYGNGGSMLTQKNADSRPRDVTQNAIWVKGEEDGKFDTNDAIFFYAEGPHVVNYDLKKKSFQHQTNCYSDTSFYFLTVGASNGLRVKTVPAVNGNASQTVTEFADYWFHEKEAENFLKSGRGWWGEYLGGVGVNFRIELPGIVPSSEIILSGAAVGTAQVRTKFNWLLDGKILGESQVEAVGSGTYDLKGQRSEISLVSKAGTNTASSVSIGATYNNNGQSSAIGYLDYLAIQVRRELGRYEGQQIYRFLPAAFDTLSYALKNASGDWLLWNITDPMHPSTLNKSSGNVTLTGGRSVRQFIGFTEDQAFIPTSVKAIKNQNLSEIPTPDLIIITAPSWKSEAQKLASHRIDHDNLDVVVVTTSEVFNEYSSGKTDPTAIRDFVRALSQKSPGKLKYLLLFGDAAYDYKNNLKNQAQSQRDGWVPVYESRESLAPLLTYSSDDFYSFLDQTEGEWDEAFTDQSAMDLAVGRLPVKTAGEARIVVDKLITYDEKDNFGNWRNAINFVADDGDGNVHQDQADQLAQFVNTDFVPKRIFVDAFAQTTTSSGQKAPAVNAAINKSINQGTLVLNYTGHGGVSGWAEEQILTLQDILSVRGNNNLPLLLTATCDFGRYDDPALVSGAELMVLSPKGAAIGAVSTTRPVFSSTNFTLSKAFYESLLKSGSKTRLGDVFMETKNNAIRGTYNRNFTLLGDPSMKLAKPGKQVRWTQNPDTLKAVKKENLSIEIYDKENGLTDQTFNGIARVVVYDKATTFRTLGTEGAAEAFSEFSSKLFEGDVSVRDGKINLTFMMPKDIDYRFGNGKVSVYAVDSDSLSDAGGQLDVLIGGSGELVSDTKPPVITGYLNSETFRNGDLVDDSPILIAKLSDDNGINVSGAGIGHNITMTLNDTMTVVMNDYFIADLDDYRSGTIRYPFGNLPSGNYTIRIKVWDTYTNFSEIAFGFLVGGKKGIQITDWKIFPNPFSNELSFEVSHDRINEDLEINFHLLLSTGQKIGSLSWQYYNTESVINESLTSTKLLQAMVPLISYLYTIEIKSLKDNSFARRSGRIMRSP